VHSAEKTGEWKDRAAKKDSGHFILQNIYTCTAWTDCEANRLLPVFAEEPDFACDFSIITHVR
jgi:hypothetical protein